MARQERFRNSLLALLLLLIVACNTATTSITVNEKQEYIAAGDSSLSMLNGVIMRFHQPFSGVVFALYPGLNDTMEITSYKKGVEDGEWRKYYPMHQLRERRYFIAGQKTGEFTSYWPNGKMQMQYFFEDGEYEGTCKEWNEAGMITKIMNYKHGYEEGHQQWWYDNGKIKANYVMKDGRRFGLLGTKNCVNVSDSIFN